MIIYINYIFFCVDHWHHRQARDTLSKRDFHADMNNKAINLLALGNCAAQSSYDYIVSYLNDTDTHLDSPNSCC